MILKAPFPWFGGKSRVADIVWDRFGNVDNFVEPFAGSLAVLLGNPTSPQTETVNDLDCYLANFWRAITIDPEGTAAAADWPVNEADLHARHLWLVNQDEFREKMKTDPDFFDVRIAGWWVWGISQWIGSGWCSRPDWTGRTNAGRAARGGHRSRHVDNDGKWNARPILSSAGEGVHREGLSRQIPSLRGDSGAAGQGIFSARVSGKRRQEPPLAEDGSSTVWRKRPDLHCAGKGVNAKNPGVSSQFGNAGKGRNPSTPSPGGCGEGPEFVPDKRPHLSGRGSGIGIHGDQKYSALYEYFFALADRLRRVRVCCGDWTRVLGPSVTVKHGVCGVFLDPPYDMRVVSNADSGRDGAAPSDGLYAHHSNDVSRAVREWAIENGENPLLRIGLCGYEGEHTMPESWECVPWKAHGGYGAQKGGRGNENAARERIWFSPHCLMPQGRLF